MIANVGYGILWLTFILAIYSAGAAAYGGVRKSSVWVESARLATLLVFPLLTLAAGSLVYLLATGHYEVEFVYNVTSNSMPLYLKMTALWGGQSGSLLFWVWLMAAFSFSVMLRNWERDREFLPWVILVPAVTLVFFLGLSVFVENPFVRYWETTGGEQIAAMFKPLGAALIFPADGRGLNPLLRHLGMVIHPPMLYLGFVSFIIPFSFGIAALITGRNDDRWIRLTRRWSLVAWLFLSLGLILGSRWAYDVLGWGGYWAWDAVEIAAFMPWLTGTAFLHSVMIQEKTGMFKRWNMVLIIITYALVIFGTFLTRSGVLSSVHAFSQSAIGPLFFGFIAITFAISLGLLLWCWVDLRAEGGMHSLLSREALFLFNNLLFMGILIVCFWGVIYPIISELFTGQKVTVGPPFYERATAPLFAGLLLLMGVAPLSAWGHSTWKTLGKAIWKPFLVSIIVIIVVLLEGIRSVGAIFVFWLISLVASVTLYEYGRAAFARARRTGENLLISFWKLAGHNRRRYGGYIIHLGVVVMALGIIGIELFQTETQGTIARGQSLSIANYTITYADLAIFDTPEGRNVARAVVHVTKNGRDLGELYPRRDYYYESQQPMTIPGVRSTLEDDVYVLLVDWLPITADGATFKIYHNPLVNWLWVGGYIFVLGTLVAAWPDADPEREKRKKSVIQEAENASL
ncbi:MAG: heme lyase CcmF/NrfE family subunit [Leptolinea sp.]